jgi:hypothetical protein
LDTQKDMVLAKTVCVKMRHPVATMSHGSSRPKYYQNVFPADQQRRRQPFVSGGAIDGNNNFLESAPKRLKVAESDPHPSEPIESAAEFYDSVIKRPSENAESRKKKNRVSRVSEPEYSAPKEFYCEICDIHAESLLIHCSTSSHMVKFAQQNSQTPVPAYGIPQTNKGYQILRDKMNWRQEKGLGRDEQGRLFPVPTTVKLTRTGLGGESDAEKKVRITHLTDPTTASPIVGEPTAPPAPPITQRTRKTIDEDHSASRKKEAQIRRVVRSDLDLLEAGLLHT